MAASLSSLPSLCAAPNSFGLFHPRCGQINLRSPMAQTSGRAVKAATLVEEAAGSSGTEPSAWASVRQERWEGDLAVDGCLPLWLNGTYLRNGPGLWDVGGRAFHHLFDGYATLVRVSFRGGRATGAHRQIESDAYRAARAHGEPRLREFSHCPKPANLLDRVTNLVGLVSGAVLTDNPNSAVLPLGDGRVMCLTETTKSSILIDPDSLDTVGKFRYTDRLGGMIQSAHPIVTDSEFLTLLPDLVRPGHLVVRMEAGSSERKVIGRVDCRGGPMPGWMHSFAVTEKYVVVPEMPLRYSSTSLLKSELAEFYAFDWLPTSGSYMHVMCRSTGKTVASVEVPPFMAIHFINAYEEEGEDGGAVAVVVDCCEHNGDPAIIETLVLRRLRSLGDKDILPSARCHELVSVPAGWGGSGYRWTGARSASSRRRWTRRSTGAAWTCAASTRRTSAGGTGTPTPAARGVRATSPTRSPRSTWWRRRPRTGTRRAPCRRSPSSWPGRGPPAKTTEWSCPSCLAEMAKAMRWCSMRRRSRRLRESGSHTGCPTVSTAVGSQRRIEAYQFNAVPAS